MGGIGDIALGSVEHPSATGLCRDGLHPRRIRTGAWFGQPERGNLARSNAGQPFGLLRRGPAIAKRRTEHADVDRDDRTKGGHRVAQHMIAFLTMSCFVL